MSTPETPETESPALRFLERAQQLTRLQLRILSQMIAASEAERAALAALEVKTPEDVAKAISVVLPGLAKGVAIVADSSLMLQLFFARHVDNFQSFLEEVCRRILIGQPRILNRGENVPMEFVLSHSTMADFIAAAVDSRIHAWGYMSIRDLNSALADLTKFRLFPAESDVRAIEALYDIRNLFTHNYGLVSKVYLAKHPDCRLPEGSAFALALPAIQAAWERLTHAATDIERRARGKFGWQ